MYSKHKYLPSLCVTIIMWTDMTEQIVKTQIKLLPAPLGAI